MLSQVVYSGDWGAGKSWKVNTKQRREQEYRILTHDAVDIGASWHMNAEGYGLGMQASDGAGRVR
jgi:hypothetical protein